MLGIKNDPIDLIYVASKSNFDNISSIKDFYMLYIKAIYGKRIHKKLFNKYNLYDKDYYFDLLPSNIIKEVDEKSILMMFLVKDSYEELLIDLRVSIDDRINNILRKNKSPYAIKSSLYSLHELKRAHICIVTIRELSESEKKIMDEEISKESSNENTNKDNYEDETSYPLTGLDIILDNLKDTVNNMTNVNENKLVETTEEDNIVLDNAMNYIEENENKEMFFNKQHGTSNRDVYEISEMKNNYYNVLSGVNMDKYIDDTLYKIKNCVAMTLGPYAKTTIVQDRTMHHNITKDGYTVLRSLVFEDDISRTIFEIVLKISKGLVRVVGDGSTSCIVVAYSLYRNLKLLMEQNKITSKDILDIMTDYAKLLEEKILSFAEPISDDMKELEDIATISCNNDDTYGKLIKDIFTQIGRYGFINLEKSRTSETYYEIKNGFELPRGYIANNMVNQADKKSVILYDPKVLMIEGRVEEKDLQALADFLGKFCMEIGGSLVIVASGYSNEAFTFFHMNRLNAIRQNNEDHFKVVAIDTSLADSDNKNRFEDLAINLGAHPIRISDGDELSKYDPDLLLTKCGSCKEFKGDEFNSRFIDGLGNKDLKQLRVDAIKKKLDEITSNESNMLFDTEIYELRKRMALLQNSMATLYIGGNSEQQKDTDRFLLEDAVSACKSALKYGFIFGGNLVIPVILHKEEYFNELVEKIKEKYDYIDENTLINILKCMNSSFIESFYTVLKNFYHDDDEAISEIIEKCLNDNMIYNLKMHRFENLVDTKIINSAKTDIEILNSVISIIGLVATSNQFVGLNLRKTD